MKKDNIIYANFSNDPSNGAKKTARPMVTATRVRTINGFQVHTSLHNLSPSEFAYYIFREAVMVEKEYRLNKNI